VITKLSEVWSVVEAAAVSHGALRVGASGIEDAHAAVFEDWLDRGHEAGMAYLRKNRATRTNPTRRFPWSRSVIVVTVPYASERGSDTSIGSHIARYALGDDYHTILDVILRNLEERLKTAAPDIQTRRYVDTGPLSDRSYAAQAGLGWIGKNGMLIDPEHGSYTFIGTLLTSLEQDMRAEEVVDRCGTCTRCIDACPTGAILPDRTIASEVCISYATIEHRGPIPDPIKRHLAGNVFGCDICNEVCPWNQAPAEPREPFRERSAYRARPVSDLLRMSQADFSDLFRNSAVKRARRVGLMRNAVLAATSISAEDQRLLREEDDPGLTDALAWRRGRTLSG
jgi:epoxyqueuosine reductase